MFPVMTIGHSNHDSATFIGLLTQHGVTAIADVRSAPFSRYNPQFNRDRLRDTLRSVGIKYVFLGEQLGARTDDASCYEGGKVQYDRLSKTVLFRKGIERVLDGARSQKIALMCAEKEPLDCHRTILVARAIFEAGIDVQHILADGSVETHQDTICRLLSNLSLPEQDMFRSPQEIQSDAYAIRGQQIAFDQNAVAAIRDEISQDDS